MRFRLGPYQVRATGRVVFPLIAVAFAIAYYVQVPPHGRALGPDPLIPNRGPPSTAKINKGFQPSATGVLPS